ncbi:putative E3 ubiquitin protein ligase [Seiridium unicorne]|uniref:E3 ubiquitin protein ligase n=1 Tax=Seiridium unicorne TaxID=138068 RepID=A0ABR2UPC4_9PEZI
MEDRKRPALSATDDIAPPSKRQQINGGANAAKDDDSKEDAWIEEYTRGAIYRQMQEYKRTCNTLEARLEEMERRSAHHDDHLRVVDAWWIQLLQELKNLAEKTIPFQPDDKEQIFPTHTTFKDLQELESHLSEKASVISEMADSIFARLATKRPIEPNVATLESQVNKLLAEQKEFLVKINRLSSEKEGVSDQLNTATLRYMKAERKMDRLKSSQVQKLEQQALASSTARPAGLDHENGVTEVNGNSAELQLKLKEATAVSDKQKQQLETALSESKKLQEELTTLQAKLTGLTDEDYARTDAFKSFKSRQDDLVKKINLLESQNKRLTDANTKLEAERSSYKKRLESEAQQLTTELEDQLQQSDTNLARVRVIRDELHQEVQKLQGSKEQERIALEEMKSLVSANEDCIRQLESQVQRLTPSEDVDMTPRPDVESLAVDDLREKYKKLQRDFESINSELPAMAAAVKKYQILANKKVYDVVAVEDRISVALAEKGKANQKYFDARRNHDALNEELKKVRMHNSKNSEVISQLKENENQSRALVASLEKQIADLKQANATMVLESKRTDANNNEMMKRYEALRAQITELSNLAKTKDTATAMARERASILETENEKLKVRLDSTSKDRDKWKVKSLSNSSEEEEMLRKLATCSVCHNNFKNTALKTCGHIFCRSCIDDRISNRMRKCPNCSKMFDKLDVMTVHL